MSIAVPNSVDEKTISWNKKPLIDNSSAWGIESGDAYLGNRIRLFPNSEIKIILLCQDDMYKANYIKLLTHITCDNTTLSTDNVHNVCVICEVIYLVDTENYTKEETVLYEYYPKYDFEDSYKNDYTIIQALNSNIKRIEMSIVNYEEEPIDINDTGFYISSVVDEGTVNNLVIQNIENYVPSGDGGGKSCIDVLDSDPDPVMVNNGINANSCYMYILRSSIE